MLKLEFVLFTWLIAHYALTATITMFMSRLNSAMQKGKKKKNWRLSTQTQVASGCNNRTCMLVSGRVPSKQKCTCTSSKEAFGWHSRCPNRELLFEQHKRPTKGTYRYYRCTCIQMYIVHALCAFTCLNRTLYL